MFDLCYIWYVLYSQNVKRNSGDDQNKLNVKIPHQGFGSYTSVSIASGQLVGIWGWMGVSRRQPWEAVHVLLKRTTWRATLGTMWLQFTSPCHSCTVGHQDGATDGGRSPALSFALGQVYAQIEPPYVSNCPSPESSHSPNLKWDHVGRQELAARAEAESHNLARP